MMERRRVQWKFIAAITTLAAICLPLLLSGGGQIDRPIYEALYAGHRPLLFAVERAFTALGEPTVLIAAGLGAALWLWCAGRGRRGLTLLLIALLGRALGEGQKYWVAPVPPALEPHLGVV